MSDAPAPVKEPIVSPETRAAARAMGGRLVGQCEGFRAAPYQDSGGTWTIGIGSIRLPDGSPVTADTPPITYDEAVAWCEGEMNRIDDLVDQSLQVYATEHQLAALYSFAYNEGPGAERSSTTLRLLNRGDVQAAADAMLLWNKVRHPATGELVFNRGLANRRALERSVFLGEVTP